VNLDSLLVDYLKVLQRVDVWFSDCAELLGDDLQCKAGCSACCRGLFDISLPEALLLQQAFNQLPQEEKNCARAAAEQRLVQLQQSWPDWAPPYLLNGLPDAEWAEMPGDDPTPCPLLGSDGRCLVYAARPMTCRLHGLPVIDPDGSDFTSAICDKNRIDPADSRLGHPFTTLMEEENRLFRAICRQMTDRDWIELDTFIPMALLWDLDEIDWSKLRLFDPR